MPEHKNNVVVTHVWPYSKLVNPEAQPFSNEREADVWDELRTMTFDEDLRGKICVALHASSNHNGYTNDFKRELEQDDVVNNRVAFYRPREVEFNVHRPATPEYTYQPLRSVAEEFTPGPDGWEEVPDTSAPIVIASTPARDEKEKRVIPFHLGSKVDAESVIKQHREHEICALVLWFPDESRHLTHLPMVLSRCPDLPVYIFHCDYRTDRYGVEREGCVVGSLWDTQSEMTDEKELQAVIEHIANQGESTWIFAPPKHGKTWVMLCVAKALLTGKPLFDVSRLRVPNPSQRVIYLCPEASRTSLRKRLKKLGLIEYL